MAIVILIIMKSSQANKYNVMRANHRIDADADVHSDKNDGPLKNEPKTKNNSTKIDAMNLNHVLSLCTWSIIKFGARKSSVLNFRSS